MTDLTLLASTATTPFASFGPYVASVNDRGHVAFQAGLVGGGTGIFVADGITVVHVDVPERIGAIQSHPDVSDDGTICAYAGGGEPDTVVLVHEGAVRTIASAREGFTGIGPAGPTIDARGAVAFRGERLRGVPGIFLARAGGIEEVAVAGERFVAFHGLPLLADDGTVRFRADRVGGVQGLFEWTEGTIEALVETGDRFVGIAPFPSQDAGRVLFAGVTLDGTRGVFAAVDGQIVAVTSRDEPFASFRGALGWPGGVVRIATTQDGELGLFAGPDPVDDRILAVGDAFLGSAVTDLAANHVSINRHGRIALRATLADGHELILRWDPTP